ncbi:MAG: metal-dependent phosphohydrolase, partial [Planctomycetaceae bacterium]|nr:metal-dependent phosphohydrolase [Planctomycetaceae bacterium]
RVRRLLPADLQDIPLGIDVARHYHRPSSQLPSGGQNFVLDPTTNDPQVLSDDELFRSLPTSFSIFRIYSKSHENDAHLNEALNRVLGDVTDAKTNM